MRQLLKEWREPLVKAIIDIDIVDSNTGEVLKTYKDEWLGNFRVIKDYISRQFNIDNIERKGDLRTIYVSEKEI